MHARTRYDYLASDRSQFLEEARQASELTLPYLIRGHEEHMSGMKQLKTPYQSVGAKGCVTLASKLMLALLHKQLIRHRHILLLDITSHIKTPHPQHKGLHLP